jgi:hypothetical protein
MLVGYNKGDIMVRRTRVNCKICKSFDGNDVCEKCYNKLYYDKGPMKKVFRCDLCGDTVDNYDEKNLCYKCSKDFSKKYKCIGREHIAFPGMLFLVMFFSYSGAILLGDLFIAVDSYIKFINSVLVFNFNIFLDLNVYIHLFLVLLCIGAVGYVLEQVYVEVGDDEENCEDY